jgi:hypothetical protein
MTEPFLPPGVDRLPARRFIVWADHTHRIRHIDESRLDRVGETVLAYWDSPSLNGGQGEDREFTLTRLLLVYSAADDSEVAVRASGDGGVSWEEAIFFEVLESGVGVKRVARGFNVSGFDLRFRVVFPEDEVVIIHEYSARLLPRSEYIIGP